MARLYINQSSKEDKKKELHPYLRYLNFYLVVTVLALLLRWLGLKQYILCFFVSYCTLKYLFSIIRQVDMHFDTNVTDIIEDNTMFYEGSFMADLQNALNLIATLLLPHFKSIMKLSFSSLITGVLDAVRKQKPIEYNGELVDLDSPVVQEIQYYSKMIVGAYGKKITVKSSGHELEDCLREGEFGSSSFFEIQAGDEAYIEFLLDHTNLEIEDLLYCCFEGDELIGEDGVSFHSPPLFILRDCKKKTIILLVRGTQSMNDVIVDVYGHSMKWEEGVVHEGMGMIAKWIAKDNIIVSTIEDALVNNPDYTLTVIGHSLGASVAALTAIYWKNHNTFRRYARSFKKNEFLRCFAYAPAPMLSKEIKEKGVDFVISIVNEDDIVPRLNTRCIYNALDSVEACVREREAVEEVEDARNALTSMKKEQLRNSLRSIRHSYKNEEPEENQTFTFKLKTAFGQKIQTLTQNIKNFGQNLKKRKEKKDETPIYGDYVLPGTIYLLHPYIGNLESYQKYEEMKSELTTSWKAVYAFIKATKTPKAPGIMHFETENEFPQILRLSPYIIVHHDFRTYENSINRIVGTSDENKK